MRQDGEYKKQAVSKWLIRGEAALRDYSAAGASISIGIGKRGDVVRMY